MREVRLAKGRCDYLLLIDRKPVGIVEATKEVVTLSSVADQSGQYAGNPEVLRASADPCLRDPTRGGVTSALTEIAQAAKVGIFLDESTIPIREDVKGACEILGLDPLYVANEGKLIAIRCRC